MAEIDFDAISAEATNAERLLVLDTEDNGLPPAIDRVVADYRTVIRLMNWLDNGASLLRYELFPKDENDFLERFKKRVSAVDVATDTMLDELVADFSVVRPPRSDDPNVTIRESPPPVA